MSAREFLLVLTNVLLGAFVLTCVILVLCSAAGDIIRRQGARVLAGGRGLRSRVGAERRAKYSTVGEPGEARQE